jgi:RNA polymerase sigma-70 factor (ECF subfamily)
MPDKEDNDLIRQCLAGDEQSLELLLGKYLAPVYSFVCRYVGNSDDAKDIVQETWIKAWKHLKRFDTNKNFKPWIFSIAKNTALDALKKKKSIPFSAFENEQGENVLENTIVDPAPLPSELLERRDIADMLEKSLSKLSSQNRAVVHLYYNEQLTFHEIAEILGEPLNTVKSRYRRALALLRELLLKEKNSL